MDLPAPAISDQPDARRIEAHLGDDLAGFIDYHRAGDRLILIHTDVLPAFEGRGIASAMARHVLGAARARQDRVSIKCPYLQDFVARHPAYAPAADGRIPPVEAG